jgi:hypothetical protein
MDFNSMIGNVRRAMSLDQSFYQEVSGNERYQREALMVVIVAAALTGLGAFLRQLFALQFFGALIALIVGVAMAVVGYYIWAYVVYWVGAKFFHGQATAPQLLRTLGYAYGPTALAVFSFIPCVGGLIALVGGIWSLVCGYFAVRETHRLSDGQTILTAVTAVVGAVFGLSAMGMNAIIGR